MMNPLPYNPKTGRRTCGCTESGCAHETETPRDIKFLRSKSGDWVGIYVNDTLIDEGHSLQEESVVRALGLASETLWSDKPFEVGAGKCPQRWLDVEAAEF